MDRTRKIGIVGAGLIGRAWAIVFARAGHPVTLWDGSEAALAGALDIIRDRLEDLERVGLTDDAAAALARISPVATLAEALAGAEYVQENLPERVEVKRAIFAEMDVLARPDAILASSTSALMPSMFTEEIPGRTRCLVAHPANPPYLLPIVELCGAPWTSPETLAGAREILASVGQEPILVQREIQGFILNRIQGALLSEAFRLVQEGYVTPDDLDKTVAHGLGLRWSFMGPFETIDLNAPGGVRDYNTRYGEFYRQLREQAPTAEPWSEEVLNQLAAERGADTHASREAWRDHRLLHLAAHKRVMREE